MRLIATNGRNKWHHGSFWCYDGWRVVQCGRESDECSKRTGTNDEQEWQSEKKQQKEEKKRLHETFRFGINSVCDTDLVPSEGYRIRS